MSVETTPIRAYRWFVFLITLGYFTYRMYDADPAYFGMQFRFLTIWALTLSTISAWLMLRQSMGWSAARHEVLASVTLVVNATVVLMYWKIYLEDPALFYGADGDPSPWHQEYFLHGLGPALQAFDALLVLGVFRPIKRIALWVLAVPVLYIGWIEWIVRPLNVKPVGEVTNGLPYLFLNNLDVSGRLTFYGTTIVTMLVLMLVLWGLAALIRRFATSRTPVTSH